MTREDRSTSALRHITGSLLATPVWQERANKTSDPLPFAERHVIVCELADVDVEELASLLPLSEILSLHAETPQNIAQRYTEYAVACFEQIQTIFQNENEGSVLLQIAVADESPLFGGLSGLLKTATLENPQFIGQLVCVPGGTAAEDLEWYLNDEMSRTLDVLVRYEDEDAVRRVVAWQEVAKPQEAPVAFKDQAVYLITGGLGGLGLIFAREILEQTRDARVVLTGRSALIAEKQALLDGLSGRVSYRQLDLTDLDQVERLIAAIKEEYGQLDGILHNAGMTADRFIRHTSAAELTEVLAPKVTGTFNLDQATRDVELDFFVLFSSVAGAMGNPGQAGYAMANAFMDQFAAYRNDLVSANERQGRTRSINWPLWQAGGKKVDRATEVWMQTTGMHTLQTATGVQAFHASLALPYSQILVVEGELTQIRRDLLAKPALQLALAAPTNAAAEVAPESLDEET